MSHVNFIRHITYHKFCMSCVTYGTYLQEWCHILPWSQHCNTLQHTATHYNTLQHTATHCNTLQFTATHCNTLQHTIDFIRHAKYHDDRNESCPICTWSQRVISPTHMTRYVIHQPIWMSRVPYAHGLNESRPLHTSPDMSYVTLSEWVVSHMHMVSTSQFKYAAHHQICHRSPCPIETCPICTLSQRVMSPRTYHWICLRSPFWMTCLNELYRIYA